jgi:hypothetical protein
MYIMHGMHNMRIKNILSCTFTILTVREEVLSGDGTFTKIVIMKGILIIKVKCFFYEMYFPFPS